ncbi:unnamed protein product [Rhizophagus irregularis]|nr:unnamed protein product [Rhizophagus irregularis]CAB4428123.1 unnamed protein product [Rhizophagus irregularis]CAB4434714.1 unnamed protein product [Rhizophagus irregularis]
MEQPSRFANNLILFKKNYGAIKEGGSADLLARMWRTGEEVFVGEQAGPPSKPDLKKLTMDSFKLYREMRDCTFNYL